MRVLVVARWYPGHDDPGRGSFVADLVSALLDQACDVRVASWDYAHYGTATSPQDLATARRVWGDAVAGPDAMNTPRSWGVGVPVARLPDLYVAGESVRQRIDGHAALLVPFGVALHDRWPYDVIHAHTAVPDGAAAIELAREVGVPVMVTEHDRTLRQRLASSDDERSAYRAVIEGAGAVVAVSHGFRDLLVGALGLEGNAVGVLPNPIPKAFFETDLDGRRQPDEILYVGARKEDKGIVTLLEAFALAHRRRPTLRLRLIGRSVSAADEERWQQMARELGIAAAVSFEAPVDRESVARAMAAAGAFVHPSPFESFGMVAAEALASGLPIAATPSGIEEIVGRDGRSGAIADGFDAAALSDAILRVVEDMQRFDPQRQREAVRRFQASEVARQTMARYEAIIAAHPGRGSVREEPARDASRDPARPAPGDMGGVLAIGQNAVLAERRLATLPPALRQRVVLMTRRPGEALHELLSGRVIDTDAQRAYQRRLTELGAPPGVRRTAGERLFSAIRSPRQALERRRVRGNRAEVVAELLAAQLTQAWEDVAADGSGARILWAMDVEDVIAAKPLTARGVRVAPGSTRWLADRWDEWASKATEQAR